MGKHRAVRSARRSSLVAVTALAMIAALAVTVRHADPALADPPGNPYGVELAIDANPAPAVFETTLVASEALIDINNGFGPTTKMWTYNGVVPGPEIRVNVGDTVIVHFENQLPEPMGIHWHGIELNNISDGTAITQNGVPTGGSYLYRFTVPRPGVYWYHPHHHPTNPTFRGMYGSFIVNSPDEDILRTEGVLPSAANTKTLVVSDTTVCKGGAFGPNDTNNYPAPSDSIPWAGGAGSTRPANQVVNNSPKKLCEESPLDAHGAPGTPFEPGDIPFIQPTGLKQVIEGQTVLANGQNRGARAGLPTAPAAPTGDESSLDVQAGQGLRLQIVNAATTRFFRFQLTTATGAPVTLYRVGGEGGLLDRVRTEGQTPVDGFTIYDAGQILLAPGNRADVVVQIPVTASGVLTLWTLDATRTGQGFSKIPTVPVMHLNVTGPAAVPFVINDNDPLLVHPSVNHAVVELPAGIGPADTGFGPGKEGSPNPQMELTNNAATEAGIDGVKGEHDGGLADYRDVPHVASTRYGRIGDVLELSVFNGTPAQHPFHLHGFSMQPTHFTRLTPSPDDAPDAVETVDVPYNEYVDEVNIPGNSTMFFRTLVEDRKMMDGLTDGGVIGRWVFHCHIFFHASGGMISEIVILGDDSANEKPFVNANSTSVEIDPGETAEMNGTLRDPDGDGVTLTSTDSTGAAIGDVNDNGDGTWSWSADAPPAGMVYITATDDGTGELKAQDGFLVEIANQPPTVTIDPAQATTADEGATFDVLANFTDPNSGDTYTATIDYGDGEGAQPATVAVTSSVPNDVGTITGSHEYGDNGTYSVVVEVSDGELTDSATFDVVVSNVAPVVTADPAAVSVEGAEVTVSATYADAGWLDSHSATIDFGNGDGPQPVSPTGTENNKPDATGTVSDSVVYGDNGTFTVTVTVTDDDEVSSPGTGVGTTTIEVVVDNINPDGTIDESGTVLVNGVPTIFADVGQSVPFNASVDDPGSDDLTGTWNWDDGSPSTSFTSLVNPPFPEPPDTPSPSVQPREDVLFPAAHTFTQACLYDVGFTVDDDDDGTDTDTVAVIITGAPTLSRGAGYWQTAYKGTGGAGFTAAQLQCYLDIAAFLSDIFSEVRDASTVPIAYNGIFVAGLHGNMSEQLDRQLLTAWINFANGGVEYNEMLDTDNDKQKTLDTSFINVMTNAELVRANPASTKSQLQAQRDILTRINGRDGL